MDVRGRPLHVGVQLQAQRSSWADYARAVAVVEDLGFDSVWTLDHLLPFAGADDQPSFETLTTQAALALLTTRARIGVLVAGVLYRDPATLAKSAAQVDQMSGGRLEFSLVAAWAEREFTAYGLPFPPLAERYERTDEALTIVKALWTQPRTTVEGRHYRVVDAPCEPKPVQSPHPPITIGGNGLGSLRLTARHADRWNAQGSVEKCVERTERLRQCCEEVARDLADIELSLHPSVAVAATHEEAEAEAARVVAGFGGRLDDVRDRWLIGTPDEVAEQLCRYLDVGFSHVVIGYGHPFDPAPLRLLREEVLPALAPGP